MRLFDQMLSSRAADSPEVKRLTDKLVEKAGARFSKKDMEKVQKCHDTIASLCDKVHCAIGYGQQYGNEPGQVDTSGGQAGMLGPDIKAGARHSNYDMMHMKSVHDSCVALGAKCM